MNSEVMQWLALGILMTICVGMVIIFAMQRHDAVRSLAGCVGPILLTMVLFTLLVMFVFVLIRSPYHHRGFMIPPGTEAWALVIAGACAGLCLYFLRAWHKGIYGSIEVLVAAVILVVSSLSMSENTVTTNTIAFLSAIYVLVRGLTNISEHRRSRNPPSV